ncbi:MAG TPA: ABC transporter ATP-binding protein [Stellaceae bacterium]|jgi:branched-chain amino acid transport system ATP-binding protein|nr:ABC transporter ATP-binding protein [Stellaceae bacterium]
MTTESPTPPLLLLEHVSKNFGALKVIDDLSLTVGTGEALGILGPNGAGKTTLFNLIAGDLPVGAGTIRFAEQDVTVLPAHARCRLGIGRTYQIPHPFGKMTVFENVLAGAAFGAARREAESHQRCIELLHLTNLLAKANLPAGSLTLLERKRLELARALATDPKLLLLDEIAGGLTDTECQLLIETIRAVHASGVSIVWIEHIVHALIAVVGRLFVINFGQKLAEGEPRAVMDSPQVQEVYMGIEAE